MNSFTVSVTKTTKKFFLRLLIPNVLKLESKSWEFPFLCLNLKSPINHKNLEKPLPLSKILNSQLNHCQPESPHDAKTVIKNHCRRYYDVNDVIMTCT